MGQRLLVYLEKAARVLHDRHGTVLCLPLGEFVERLWAGDLLT